MHRLRLLLLAGVLACLLPVALAQPDERRWLPGDSHIHSQWSPGYDRTTTPPTPRLGEDALYSTPLNAQMARQFGLKWMVTTDHGGANHAKLNLLQAYDELRRSRQLVPDLLQFYGMELNMPGMDHHTLIIPRSEDEALALYEIERRFDANETFPRDPARNTAEARVAALRYMNALPRLPLVFANHPSRSATGLGVYGLSEPREIRDSIDTAPEVYRAMEGAPGHQASGVAADGTVRLDKTGWPTGTRGGYNQPGAQTLGGFDQMTAIVGGLWDALLGEGRRFWIVASSDSHANFTELSRRGNDFWPGQFHKTYVFARPSYDDVLDGLRQGRIFVAAGDLISSLTMTATAGDRSAGIGETLRVVPGERVDVTILFDVPAAPNASGARPAVTRVDVIAGDIRPPAADRTRDRNETTRVAARFDPAAWRMHDGRYAIEMRLPPATRSTYLRVRGTSTRDLEPVMDLPGENPWQDLWFYGNPIFIEVAGALTTTPLAPR